MRREAASSVLLALLFYAFFTASKHLHVLSDINPFAEDPYDALGSFAVQLAPFLALLSALRAYRPNAPYAVVNGTSDLVRRGALLAALAVSIALAGDVVALIRHISLWAFTPAGQGLAAGTILLLLCSLHQVKRHWSTRNLSVGRKQRLILMAGIAGPLVCLVLFPEHVRQTLAGALFTAFFGIILFFLPLGVLAYIAMRPPAPDHRTSLMT